MLHSEPTAPGSFEIYLKLPFIKAVHIASVGEIYSDEECRLYPGENGTAIGTPDHDRWLTIPAKVAVWLAGRPSIPEPNLRFPARCFSTAGYGDGNGRFIRSAGYERMTFDRDAGTVTLHERKES